jgi:hypothetical protein
MIDLGRFEERLNSDPNLRQEFLRDPVQILRREGVVLSAEQARRLRDAVSKISATRPPVGGATIKEKIGIIMIGG